MKHSKIVELYMRCRDVFDPMTDDELLRVPWCLYCDHNDKSPQDFDARRAEAEVCEWLLKRRGRNDMLRDLAERLSPILGGGLLSDWSA